MKCRAATRLAILSLIIILSAFLLVSAGLPPRVSAALRDNGNRRVWFAPLEARLRSARADEFHAALAELAELDEPGAYATWRAALQHPDAQLQKAAWRAFRGVQAKLARNEFVP